MKVWTIWIFVGQWREYATEDNPASAKATARDATLWLRVKSKVTSD